MASGVRSGRLIRASYALQSAASLTVGDPCCPGWWSTVRVDLSDVGAGVCDRLLFAPLDAARSEQHTSYLQSLMRISYAAVCLQSNRRVNSISERRQQTDRYTDVTVIMFEYT